MSDDYRRIELITGTARRLHWSTEQKLQIVEESFEPGETVSSVGRRRGVAPNLLYRWRRLMTRAGLQQWDQMNRLLEVARGIWTGAMSGVSA